MNFLLCLVLALLIGVAPAAAAAAIEQCRFIQARAEREACYERQAAALAARRKPETRETTGDSRTLESLQQMRREDDEVYKSLRSICRGC